MSHFILDEQRDFEGLGRTFGVSNISLVITYVTVIIAALMLAGFLWVAFAYSGSGKRRKRRDAFYDDEGKIKIFSFLFTQIKWPPSGVGYYSSPNSNIPKLTYLSPILKNTTTVVIPLSLHSNLQSLHSITIKLWTPIRFL